MHTSEAKAFHVDKKSQKRSPGTVKMLKMFVKQSARRSVGLEFSERKTSGRK